MSTSPKTNQTANATANAKRKFEENPRKTEKNLEEQGLLVFEVIQTFLRKVKELAMDTTDTEMLEDIDDNVKPYLEWVESLKTVFDTATSCRGEIPVALIKCMMKKVPPIIDNNDEKHDMFDILNQFAHALRENLEDDCEPKWEDLLSWLERLTTSIAKLEPAKPAKRAKVSESANDSELKLDPNESAAATIKLALVDPNEFFNGKVVEINMRFSNGPITILFYGSKDGTVTIKGNFPRAGSMSAKLPIEAVGPAGCYQAACKQLLPKGIGMVIRDYPVAKAKHEKDLETSKLKKVCYGSYNCGINTPQEIALTIPPYTTVHGQKYPAIHLCATCEDSEVICPSDCGCLTRDTESLVDICHSVGGYGLWCDKCVRDHTIIKQITTDKLGNRCIEYVPKKEAPIVSRKA